LRRWTIDKENEERWFLADLLHALMPLSTDRSALWDRPLFAVSTLPRQVRMPKKYWERELCRLPYDGTLPGRVAAGKN